MKTKQVPKASVSISAESSQYKTEYDYMKLKNIELSKEVAELRRTKTRMQTDIDYLVREKFRLECKYNQISQAVSTIFTRSRIALSKIVESSTELTEIMKLTNVVQERETNSSIGHQSITKERKSTSFKQVVTPHAVNGHVIHSPTIRITRFNDPRVQAAETLSHSVEAENDNQMEEPSWNDEEQTENGEDEDEYVEDPNHSTFKSRGRRLGTSNPSLASYFEEEQESEADDNEEPVDEREDPDEATTEHQLSIINEEPSEEELEESTSYENRQFFSNRRKAERCSTPVSGNHSMLCRREEPDISMSNISHQVSFDSSVTVEASTSINRTVTFNEDLVQSPSEKSSLLIGGSSNSKRNNFLERKSTGSPLPQQASYSVNERRRRLSAGGSLQSSSSTSTLRSRGVDTPTSGNITESTLTESTVRCNGEQGDLTEVNNETDMKSTSSPLRQRRRGRGLEAEDSLLSSSNASTPRSRDSSEIATPAIENNKTSITAGNLEKYHGVQEDSTEVDNRANRESTGIPLRRRGRRRRLSADDSLLSPSNSFTSRSRDGLGIDTPTLKNITNNTNADHSERYNGIQENSTKVDNETDASTIVEDPCRASSSKTLNFNSSIEKTFHSTPVRPSERNRNKQGTTPIRGKGANTRGRSQRQNSVLIPLVRLTRLEVNDENKPNSRGSSLHSSQNSITGRGILRESQIKTENFSSTKKKSSRAAVFPSPMRESSTSIKRNTSAASDESNPGRSPKRPRRAAKPASLKEPSLNKKLRRSR